MQIPKGLRLYALSSQKGILFSDMYRYEDGKIDKVMGWARRYPHQIPPAVLTFPLGPCLAVICQGMLGYDRVDHGLTWGSPFQTQDVPPGRPNFWPSVIAHMSFG
jgi:hypothetical protein